MPGVWRIVRFRLLMQPDKAEQSLSPRFFAP